MATFTTTVLQNSVVAEGTCCIRLIRPDGFVFEAGQTIDMTLPLQESDEKGNMRTFSLASDPSKPYLEVATRIRDSAFKKAFASLEKDAHISFEGPFGSFTLHENPDRPAIILAGGIGITPFRSMVHDAIHRNLPQRIFLFYSNRRPEDAAFLNELTLFGDAHESIAVIPTMTDMEHSSTSWNGEEGFITTVMLEKFVSKEDAPICYVAGPQSMVLAMRDMLIEWGISKDDIRFEEFSGY